MMFSVLGMLPDLPLLTFQILVGMGQMTLEYLTVMYFSKYNNSNLKERENWKGDISDFGWYGTVSHTNQILKNG